MALTTIEMVRAILPAHTSLTDENILAAIDSAACMISRMNCDLEPECLTKVETYLAAHFCAATELTLSLQTEKDGCSGSSKTYGFKLGDGIMGSPFGQMANMLSCGEVQQFQEIGQAAIGIHVLGCI